MFFIFILSVFFNYVYSQQNSFLPVLDGIPPPLLQDLPGQFGMAFHGQFGQRFQNRDIRHQQPQQPLAPQILSYDSISEFPKPHRLQQMHHNRNRFHKNMNDETKHELPHLNHQKHNNINHNHPNNFRDPTLSDQYNKKQESTFENFEFPKLNKKTEGDNSMTIPSQFEELMPEGDQKPISGSDFSKSVDDLANLPDPLLNTPLGDMVIKMNEKLANKQNKEKEEKEEKEENQENPENQENQEKEEKNEFEQTEKEEPSKTEKEIDEYFNKNSSFTNNKKKKNPEISVDLNENNDTNDNTDASDSIDNVKTLRMLRPERKVERKKITQPKNRLQTQKNFTTYNTKGLIKRGPPSRPKQVKLEKKILKTTIKPIQLERKFESINNNIKSIQSTLSKTTLKTKPNFLKNKSIPIKNLKPTVRENDDKDKDDKDKDKEKPFEQIAEIDPDNLIKEMDVNYYTKNHILPNLDEYPSFNQLINNYENVEVPEKEKFWNLDMEEVDPLKKLEIEGFFIKDKKDKKNQQNSKKNNLDNKTSLDSNDEISLPNKNQLSQNIKKKTNKNKDKVENYSEHLKNDKSNDKKNDLDTNSEDNPVNTESSLTPETQDSENEGNEEKKNQNYNGNTENYETSLKSENNQSPEPVPENNQNNENPPPNQNEENQNEENTNEENSNEENEKNPNDKNPNEKAASRRNFSIKGRSLNKINKPKINKTKNIRLKS